MRSAIFCSCSNDDQLLVDTIRSINNFALMKMARLVGAMIVFGTASAGFPMQIPLPEFNDALAFHPVCLAEGQGPASIIAPRLCQSVKAQLRSSGYPGVSTVARNDSALGAPRHVVLGFTLVDAQVDGRSTVLVSAKMSRVDMQGGALYPPPATALQPGALKEDLDHAARVFLGKLGFRLAP